MQGTTDNKVLGRSRVHGMRRGAAGAALAAGLALVVALPGGAAQAASKPTHPTRPQPQVLPSAPLSGATPTDRVIVQYKDSASAAGRRHALSARGMTAERTLSLIDAKVVAVPKGQTAAEVAADLRKDPAVEYATPDVRRHPLGTVGVPDDPGFKYQWGLRNSGTELPLDDVAVPKAGVDVDALGAWSLSTTSQPVTVAVIDDTDVLTNPDLQGSAAQPGANFSSTAGSSGPHGTHVAGIIAANRDNGQGVAGLASDVAGVMPLRFMTVDSNGDPQGGTDSDAIAAIQYARDHGVKIINASWGATLAEDPYAANPLLRDAISQCDCVFIAAAGNDGANANVAANRVYPAAFDLPNLVSVAAAGVRGTLAGFSNHGWTIDVAAPGDAILSTIPAPCETSAGTMTMDCYAWGSGTSMAAPFVSATAALMLGRQPSLTPVQVASTIKATVRVTGALDVTSGGMLDAGAAMRQVTSAVPVPNRLGGRDRYVTAAEVAKQFSPGVPVAYVASGEGFADALAGAALAGSEQAPLVLTASKSLPIATASALSRLQPSRIVVLGGTGAVSDTVKSLLTKYSPSVTRLEGNAQEGKDRYGTAAAVARTQNAGAGETDTVYVASGQDFPDALAAAAVAGATGQPVLLTQRDKLPAATELRLASLGPKNIVVLGGTGAVSATVAQAMTVYAPVQRIGGADRYATAALVAARLSTATSAYVANGSGFPDALAGAALAGSQGAPVLLVKRDSVPDSVAARLEGMDLERIVELGGTGSISPANVVAMGNRFIP